MGFLITLLKKKCETRIDLLVSENRRFKINLGASFWFPYHICNKCMETHKFFISEKNPTNQLRWKNYVLVFCFFNQFSVIYQLAMPLKTIVEIKYYVSVLRHHMLRNILNWKRMGPCLYVTTFFLSAILISSHIPLTVQILPHAISGCFWCWNVALWQKFNTDP